GDGACPVGHTRGGNALGDHRVALRLPDRFEDAPEKGLVLADRSSKSGAKVIALILWAAPAGGCIGGVARLALGLRVIKEVPGVQGAVAYVFEHIAVKLIASAFADNRHLAAHVHAIFGAESICDDLVFTDAIQPQRRPHGRSAVVAENGLSGCSVQQKVVRDDGRAVAAIDGALGAAAKTDHDGVL